jgi:hypothetical protein
MIAVRGEAPEKYKSAIFFDNDIDMINKVKASCPTITTHAIPETAYNIDPIKMNTEPLKSVIAGAGGEANIYIKHLRGSNVQEDYLDPVSGFSNAVHGPLLDAWIGGLEDPESSIVLFDWDRTITVFEGSYYPSNWAEYIIKPHLRALLRGVSEELFAEQALRYLMGGDERLAAFRERMRDLATRNIHIGVLTNSTMCGKDTFTTLVDILMPPEVDNLFILCSRPAPFSRHKGEKLKSIANFIDLCPARGPALAGGKRYRRLRKSKKMKRHGKRKSRKNY